MDKAQLEASIIYGLILEPSRRADLPAGLTVDDFSDKFWRDCFDISRSQPDPKRWGAWLLRRGHKNVGRTLAASLVNGFPQHLADYGRDLLELSVVERCRRLSAEYTESGNAEVLDVITEERSRLSASSNTTTAADLIASDGEYVDDRDPLWLPTYGVDRWCGQLRQGGLVTVAGRTGHGKTLFMLQTLLMTSREHVVCEILSLEMTSREIGHRLAMMVEQSQVTTEELSRVFVTSCGHELEHVVGAIHAAANRGAKVIALDYVQQVAIRNAKSLYEKTTAVMDRLQEVTKSLEITLIVGCQVARPSDRKKVGWITLHELRDSGRIEEASDVILAIRRPHNESVEGVIPETRAKAEEMAIHPAELFGACGLKFRDRAIPDGPYWFRARNGLWLEDCRPENFDDTLASFNES